MSYGNGPAGHRRRVRIYQPSDVPLARVAIGSAGGNTATRFVYPTPDARIALKISILFYQEVTGQPSANLIPFDLGIASSTASYSLSLQGADKGPTGAWIPCTNLLGAGQSTGQQQQIPLAFSATVIDNLNGYSQTIQDSQDAVLGFFFATLGAFPKGLTVMARARYNLVGSDMCDEEWDSAVAQMTPSYTQFVGI